MKRVLCPKCENYLFLMKLNTAKANRLYSNANIAANNSASAWERVK